MIIGYGYRRTEAELRALGADRVYIDHDRTRSNRADMMRAGVHRGDIVRALYLRDLGGSPVADRVWLKKIKALGARFEEIRPSTPSRPVGKPAAFVPANEAKDAQMRDIWLDGNESEAARLIRLADTHGAVVKRNAAIWRYGYPSNPKPLRDWGNDTKEPNG